MAHRKVQKQKNRTNHWIYALFSPNKWANLLLVIKYQLNDLTFFAEVT